MPAVNLDVTLNPAEKFSLLFRQPKSKWLSNVSSLVKTLLTGNLKKPVCLSVLVPSQVM